MEWDAELGCAIIAGMTPNYPEFPFVHDFFLRFAENYEDEVVLYAVKPGTNTLRVLPVFQPRLRYFFAPALLVLGFVRKPSPSFCLYSCFDCIAVLSSGSVAPPIRLSAQSLPFILYPVPI